MTVDDCKDNQLVALTATAVTDLVSVLEQINVAASTWHVAINLVNAFFSIPMRKENQKQPAFM